MSRRARSRSWRSRCQYLSFSLAAWISSSFSLWKTTAGHHSSLDSTLGGSMGMHKEAAQSPALSHHEGQAEVGWGPLGAQRATTGTHSEGSH